MAMISREPRSVSVSKTALNPFVATSRRSLFRRKTEDELSFSLPGTFSAASPPSPRRPERHHPNHTRPARRLPPANRRVRRKLEYTSFPDRQRRRPTAGGSRCQRTTEDLNQRTTELWYHEHALGLITRVNILARPPGAYPSLDLQV
jgi:hypothetical protein